MGSVALQIVVVCTPFLQLAFSTEPLTGSDWLRCAAVASTVLWLRELEKLKEKKDEPASPMVTISYRAPRSDRSREERRCWA